jgi:paraquat-inducible protein B
MSDTPQLPDVAQIPDAIVERRRRRSSQLVWIIPIIAAIIGASLAVKSYLDRGPVITITFKNGEGIEAGQTKIKYKNVQIGKVKAITITKDRSHVLVTAEIFRNADWLLMEDTRFWVVRARISRNSISGLGTLMEGSYIGVDAGTSKQSQDEFNGLERPPVIAINEPGRPFVLHAMDIGSLDITSPIFYRGIQVGEVISYELDKDGKGVTLTVFIRAPYDRYVKANTLFWHASGVDFTLDANGVKINTESMVSILLGGISFLSPEDPSNAQPAHPNSTFTLFASRDEAMKRLDAVVETYLLVFKESVRGLPIGAPVDLRGVTVGEVAKINLDLDPRNKEIPMSVEVQLYPERLWAQYRSKSQRGKPTDSRQLLNTLVKRGFRAHLRSGNLLTGQLYVALNLFPEAMPSKIDWSKNPPEFPTITSSMEQFQTTLMQIVQKIEKLPLEELTGDVRKTIQTFETTLQKIEKLPLEELAGDVQKSVQMFETTLQNADKLLKNVDASVVPEAHSAIEDVRKTLNELRKTLGVAKQTLSPDAPLQQDLRETLRELSRAAQSLRVLADYLERHPESLIRGKEDER